MGNLTLVLCYQVGKSFEEEEKTCLVILVIESDLPGDGNEAGCHGCHLLRETSLRVEMTFHNRPKDPVNGLVTWNGHIQDEEMPENIR